MGRKPDTLILTYFSRGDKIPDQSNRYSYTCRACGAVFPKGRTNHLIDHLTGGTSRCPSITPDDLTQIVAIQASKNAEKARKETPKGSGEEPSSPPGNGLSANGLSPISSLAQRTLPLGQGKNLTGLEALAEASRQVERPSHSAEERGQLSDGNVFDTHGDPFIDPTLHAFPLPTEGIPSSDQDLSSIAASASNLEASLLQLKKHVEHTPKSPQAANDNDMLHHASTWHVPIRPAPEYSAEVLAKAATFPVPIAAHPTTRPPGAEDVDLPPNKVAKTRSKFSESRRQEVQGVRQKRACIRCRMLRKPCSEEDPCPRCAEIKNPRLWSNACVRVRISEAFDLYSAGLYTTQSRSAMDYLQGTNAIEDRGDTLILRPTDSDEPSAALPAISTKLKAGRTTNGAQHDSIIIPKEEDPTIEDRVLVYLSKHTSPDYPGEISKTLSYCQNYSVDSESILIPRAVSLYKTTHVLTSRKLPLRMTPSHTSTVANSTDDQNHSPTASSQVTTSPQDQLQAATQPAELALRSIIERVAALQCRVLLNEMEKCLVSRAQAFDLLVSSFLFFACVERLEWVFRWHQVNTPAEEWLLPAPASSYAQKAGDFASFLQGLLRSRHVVEPLALDAGKGILLPTTATANTPTTTAAGTVNLTASSAASSSASPTQSSSSNAKDENVRKWFEAVGFGPDLKERCNAVFDVDDEGGLRMRHCGRFLLSAGGLEREREREKEKEKGAGKRKMMGMMGVLGGEEG